MSENQPCFKWFAFYYYNHCITLKNLKELDPKLSTLQLLKLYIHNIIFLGKMGES
jgi:hypothetical protein